MKRKKSKSKRTSPVLMPKQSGSKKTVVRRKKKRFQISNPFKKKKNKFPTRKKPFDTLKYLVLPLIFLLIIAAIYGSIRYVLLLRQNISKVDNYEVSEVLGLEEIPTYPGSEFLFSNSLNDPIVKDFLSQGNSAYKLPQGNRFADVEQYYLEKLEQMDWVLVQNVPLGTADRKYGMYWIKENKGLRIYSKHTDVWYESISVEDAQSALAYLVTEEIEREMLMATSEKQDLLPDFPWRIQIPKEYMIKYSPSQMKELRAVSFQKMGSEEIVEIFPIGYWKAKEMDFMLNDYCDIKGEEEIKCGVLNSVPISFKDTLGLKSSIQIGQDTHPAYTVANTYNDVVYIISSNTQDNPLLEYIIENIKTMDEDD